MTETRVPFCSREWLASLVQLRTWHLGLLVLYVAVAIVNIQDQRLTEPALIAIASAGFLAYATIGWLGWRYVQRFEARVGSMPLLVLYLIALAVLFLVATVAYLVIENLYLGGSFSQTPWLPWASHRVGTAHQEICLVACAKTNLVG
jgi:hypothetical protein